LNEDAIGLVIGQLHRGGAETQLVRLALELRRRGRPVRVYCLSQVTAPHDKTLRDAGVPLRTFGGRGKQVLARVLGLRRALREDGVGLVHAFLVLPSVIVALALAWDRSGPVFIASNRSQNAGRPAWRRLIEGWALRRATCVTVNYSAGVTFTESYYGVPRSRIRVIPNGVEDLSSGLPSRDTARRSLGLPEDEPVLLGLFRLSEEKDLDVFCGAAEQALLELGSGVCLIAGDGPERSMLERRIATSPTSRAFRMLGASDEVPKLLAAADLMLLTSRFEGMPNGIMEAMSAGLPVVATRVGGLPDLVEDRQSGLLCPPADTASLAAACVELLENADLRRRIGERAQQRMREAFSVDIMVDAHCALYASLLEKD